ncbi:magnesium chelatase subunit D [Tenacibaculum sp. MAR_2009_124]|uniref:AAA family ATPase n=1 Tax=Tenacibaculum sp. MAR_2009_124 TaxID=1250059 RepID=UPI00089C9903|nr:AAA family ATPase [Tenacibaculum sp. MAR_2009_124]SEB86088.1 magnesium chelatase subunit D [Tenacibaculum sp. MAR_2009_124]
MNINHSFSFSAILAQDDFKLCLLLNLIDPTIGGVLATGDKGTGKTTTVRALSELMGKDFPFVNLPIGATEDRVLGSVNIEALINQKKTVVDIGLLAKSNNGFLYIDEINLLNDYLMDVLLDASSSGGYHLEREGISKWLESRFCLVGTMNPEEGELRPQLKDRFGLSVKITTPQEIDTRKKIASRRLDFDTNPKGFNVNFQKENEKTKANITKARAFIVSVEIPEEVKQAAAKLTLESNVEGMRADILLLKTARAYAALLGEKEVSKVMLYKISPFVLDHRTDDFTPPSESDNDENQENNKEEENNKEQELQGNSSFQLPEEVRKGLKFSINEQNKKSELRFQLTEDLIKVPYLSIQDSKIDLLKTVKNYMITEKFKTFLNRVHQKSSLNVVFLIDTSASMAIDKQLGFAKGIIKKTMESYPSKRIKYAIVALENSSARIIQCFTNNKNALSNISKELRAGGKTNLANAFFKVFELLKSVNEKTVQLFIMTDGKINSGGEKPFEYAVKSYKTYLSKLKNTTVVDTESGFVKLGKAKLLADTLRTSYVPMAFNS